MLALEYPHVRKTGNEPAHLERLPRIRVAQIAADHLGNGWSAEEIVRQYPALMPAEVHAALGYYFDHRVEIDAELAGDLAELEKTKKASTLRLRLLSTRNGSVA